MPPIGHRKPACADGRARVEEQGIQMFAALIEPGNAESEAVFRSLGYDILPIRYARRKTHLGV